MHNEETTVPHVPRHGGWVPTALFAGEERPRVKKERAPEDIVVVVVDDNVSPVRVERRVPRRESDDGSDAE
jgi:hypothetical protein